ncbi:hypothetical protein [Blastopirellula retiformator]|uniref:DUF4345 domain-containing protein n=1 Tax=Blastopirellula retiformator TaxID=2527970 RepID=A0A5C5V917_9BACT|nr:hypothetical protein [Blastopirellula retiformator]TWT34235.1 hypothetical protein Enr8_16290 [Blastopirellula retiformator]
MIATWIARAFLALVGSLYVGLGIWCAVAPEKTSKMVGFGLQPGAGQSEFLTVYGGLEVGLGLLFLWPLYRNGDVEFPLTACVIVHGALVLFRSIGFFTYSGFSPMTYNLAVSEWAIFLLAVGLFFWKR